ncbi:MAG: hypothetical protein O7C75_04610, partial [Verrucomicrobia bacterium]|nr:hypothetical protein [Verrucomicrobiota bacterium]
GKLVFGIGIFVDATPEFSTLYLVRSGFVVIAAYLLFRFLTFPPKPDGFKGLPPDKGRLFQGAWSIVPSISLVATVLFIVSPQWFSKICREGHVVESISALANFSGGFVLLYSASKVSRQKSTPNPVILYGLVSGAMVFFLLGLEEISWFQRVFDLETPAIFASNDQNEINIHNFATSKLETLYYFLAFCFLVAAPVFISIRIPLRKFGGLETFYPPLQLVPSGIVITAFNYDMWNAPLTQWSFFTSLMTGLFLIKQLKEFPKFRIRLIAAILVAVFCQMVFLYSGSRFIRLWEITEYKELLISISLIIYGFHVRKAVQSNPLSAE